MISLSTIQKSDNAAVKQVIETVMTEFQCVGDGFSILDPELSDMYQAYADLDHIFYVVKENETIKGCGGIGRLPGEDDLCELKKMYFYPELRGKGAGKLLMQKLLQFAKLHYDGVYIETTLQMIQAQKLYEQFGFVSIKNPLGNTGHHGCDRFYLLQF